MTDPRHPIDGGPAGRARFGDPDYEDEDDEVPRLFDDEFEDEDEED